MFSSPRPLVFISAHQVDDFSVFWQKIFCFSFRHHAAKWLQLQATSSSFCSKGERKRREASSGSTPRGKVSFRDAASPQLVGHQGQSARGSVHGGGHLPAPSRGREGRREEGDRVPLSRRVYTLPATGSSQVEGARPFSRSVHVCGGSNLVDAAGCRPL